jgi:hypothetical protein
MLDEKTLQQAPDWSKVNWEPGKNSPTRTAKQDQT